MAALFLKRASSSEGIGRHAIAITANEARKFNALSLARIIKPLTLCWLFVYRRTETPANLFNQGRTFCL